MADENNNKPKVKAVISDTRKKKKRKILLFRMNRY